MSQYPQFSHLSRLPRTLLRIAALLVIVLTTFGKPASWAAPIAPLPNPIVSPKQLTHLPLVASPPVNACDAHHDICELSIDFADGFIAYDWSPDGRTIAFYGKVNDVPGLYTVDEQGKNQRSLLALDDINVIDYSPDGAMIALIAGRPGIRQNRGPATGYYIYDLYVYTLATGQLRLLSDPASEDFSDLSPAWSPDSHTLAFTRIQHDSTTVDPTAGDIYTLRPDGSELTQLTDTPLNENLPTYSPDGTYIAYAVVKEGSNNPSIAVMEANGDEPTILTSDEALFANDPFWAPNGNSIFFFGATENYEWDIYKVSIDGGDPVNLTHDALKQSNPLLSPDGNQIFFIGRVHTPEVFEIDLYTMNTDGSNMTEYPNPDGPDQHPVAVQWHPDGQRISFTSFNNGVHFYLLRLRAGTH